MPLEMIREDITRMQVDAVVAASNARLQGDGGVNGAIHRAAGPQMDAACRALGGCRVGEAKITPGFQLPCRYVIHTVGPVWHGGYFGEARKLRQCYEAALALAKAHGIRSIAFPMISAGTFGFPSDKALHIAAETIRDFLSENDMQVYLVLFDGRAVRSASSLYGSIREYIDDHYVDEHADMRRIPAERNLAPCASCAPVCREISLEDALKTIDESFSEMVLRLIDERGWKDSECYKRANIDRKHFSKIRSNPQYKPKKATALALAIALELPLETAQELLRKAGYALSHSSKMDIIVEYFIVHRQYDIDEINIALMDFDQPLLGA